jgi:hypothetical protein
MARPTRTGDKPRTHSKTVETALPAGQAKLTVVAACGVAAVTLAVYLRMLGHEFANVDDVDYVQRNAAVLAGLNLKSLAWAFTSYYAANWHPFTWLSHMLDVQLFGPSAPGWHHLTSVVLHTANSVLLLIFLAVTTRAVWKSAIVAALFALHPQHVESVAWVSERKDVLSAFFMMWTLLAYVYYARRPSVGRYLLVALAFALGLMAKPMLVTLPLLLLLLDYWPLGRIQGIGDRGRGTPGTRHPTPVTILLEKLPLLAMSAASCVVTVKAQSAVGAVRALEMLPLGDRIGNAVMSTVIYLSKTIWPTRLGQFYPFPDGGWPVAELIGAAVLLIGITWLAFRVRRSRPYVTCGWAWYLITLAPVVGIVQVGSQARADRYTYIPLIGVFVMIAYLLPNAMTRVQARVAGAAVLVALAGLGIASYNQAGYWRDSIALNRRAIAVTENNWYSLGSLGSLLQDRAEHLHKQGKKDDSLRLARQAEKHLRKSLAIAPNCSDSHTALARSLATLDDLAGAITQLEAAIDCNPDNFKAHDYLGMAYKMKGRLDDAIEQFHHAININPRFINAQGNLAVAYYERGDYARAWEHLHACEDAGGHAPDGFVRRLSDKMPDPSR